MSNILLLEAFTIQLKKSAQEFTANRIIIDDLLLKKQRIPLSTVYPLLPNPKNFRLVYMYSDPTICGVWDAKKTGFATQREITKSHLINITLRLKSVFFKLYRGYITLG